MIELRTLGGLDLHDPQGLELRVILTASKRAALLTYLAVATPRGFHRRDTLLALLWPELDQEHARGALRQALHLMRRSMTDGALLSEGNDEISLDRDAFWCDAVAFEQLMDEGQAEQALKLYRGELLEGFHLSGCPEFERWLEGERRRLKRRVAQAARSLVEQAEAQGKLAKAVEWARRATVFAPHDEAAVRRLISLLDRSGDRAGALREYEVFAKRLQEDYEAEPAPETTALIESVRAREQPIGLVVPVAPVTKRTDDDAVTQRTDHDSVVQRADGAVTRVTVEARRSWRTGRLVGAIVALGAVVVAGVTMMWNGRGDVPTLDPTRVLVDIFRNETGDRSLDALGRRTADQITQGLSGLGFVDVVSLPNLHLSAASDGAVGIGTDPERVRETAEAHHTGTVVRGRFFDQGDRIWFEARVLDARSDVGLVTALALSTPRDSLTTLVEQMGNEIMATIAWITDPRLAGLTHQASRPRSFDAYRQFVAGWEALSSPTTIGEALPHFLQAAALDTSFTMPLLWAMFADQWGVFNNEWWPGPSPEVESFYESLDQRDTLARVDRLFLDYLLAMRDRRRADALMAMRRLVTIDPGPDYLFIAASGAMDMNRPVEAIQLLQRADLDSVNFLSKWGLANTRLGQAYHLVGEHEAELTIAEQNLPENLNLQMVLNVIYALGALGRVEELNEVIELGMTLQPTPWRGGMFLYAADELRAHGHESDAAEFNARALAWLERRSSDGPLNPFNESYQFVTALMSAGRLEEAKEILEGLLEDSPANTVPLVHLAVIAARLGDRSEALRISRLEAVATSPYGPSQIAAELGELERAVELLRDGFSNGASGAMVLGRLHKEDYHRRLWDYPPFQELMRPKG